jgi:hypothetical protein
MGKFEFKSAIYTTKEQSERLLKLGLKKETADCHWFYHDEHWEIKIGFDLMSCENLYPKYYIPAWSLHRLMEIAYKGDILGCVALNYHERNIATYYEQVIKVIEYLINVKEFNPEYLEKQV